MLSSLTHIGKRKTSKEDGWFQWNPWGASKVILGGLSLYKPNALGLVSDAPIL